MRSILGKKSRCCAQLLDELYKALEGNSQGYTKGFDLFERFVVHKARRVFRYIQLALL